MRRVLLLTALLAVAPARAESPESASHAAWYACLDEVFTDQAQTTSRGFAATKAVTTCREREEAYLVTLSGSALLDGEDIARIRPALVARARDRLIGTRRFSAL